MTSLKRDKVCPGCDGRRVWWLEQSTIASSCEQFVCAQCGYIELYAKSVELQHNPGYGVHLIDNEPKAGLR